MNALWIALGIIAVLLGILVLSFCLSPLPASRLMRALFKKPRISPPPHYAQMEAAVRVVENIPYPSQYGRNTLDIYFPTSADGKRPVILWAHGGAYVAGDKTDIRYYATALAAQGYAVVSMNYDLAPEARYPTPFVQVADVCQWIASAQEEYTLNPEKLILAGDSAGAHIMAQYALIQTSPQYAALCNQQELSGPKNICGLLLYCGPYQAAKIQDMKGIFGFMLGKAAWAYYGSPNWHGQYGEEISIVGHITGDFPPAFITDGNTTSFADHAQALAAMLREKGVPADTFFIPAEEEKTFHEYQFIMDTPAGQECYRRTLAFLESHLGEAAGETPVP